MLTRDFTIHWIHGIRWVRRLELQPEMQEGCGRRSWRLFGGFGVAGGGVGEPDGVGVVVDAVPQPSGAGDFVLPLFKGGAVDEAGAEAAFWGGVLVGGVGRGGGGGVSTRP